MMSPICRASSCSTSGYTPNLPDRFAGLTPMSAAGSSDPKVRRIALSIVKRLSVRIMRAISLLYLTMGATKVSGITGWL
jgi:hypothetical protein